MAPWYPFPAIAGRTRGGPIGRIKSAAVEARLRNRRLQDELTQALTRITELTDQLRTHETGDEVLTGTGGGLPGPVAGARPDRIGSRTGRSSTTPHTGRSGPGLSTPSPDDTMKILRDCRLKGDGVYWDTCCVALMHKLALSRALIDVARQALVQRRGRQEGRPPRKRCRTARSANNNCTQYECSSEWPAALRQCAGSTMRG
ncbi:hypothetical protein GCM10010261_59640 [Streptomyces pilosus]|nr:hypothetical protein GCM10010261_59640 [Streptomyces pilosus]